MRSHDWQCARDGRYEFPWRNRRAKQYHADSCCFHEPSMLTNHLADMRNYMPSERRRLIEAVEAMPSIRKVAHNDPYNAVLDAMADFRAVHCGWAQEYINRWTTTLAEPAAHPICSGCTSLSTRSVHSGNHNPSDCLTEGSQFELAEDLLSSQ
jgi:hypothetical protein